MVKFNDKPEEIVIELHRQLIRYDIREIPTEDGTIWEANEIVFKGKSRQWIENNKESIQKNPLQYKPYMINGKKITQDMLEVIDFEVKRVSTEKDEMLLDLDYRTSLLEIGGDSL